jgi:hypothetical protein
LHLTLGPALINTQGPGTSEVERVYVRAWELGRQVGDTPQRFTALWGLWYVRQTRWLPQARALGEELLGVAQELQDPMLFLEAHRALGNTLIWLGEVGLAHTHFTHGLARYAPQPQRDHALRWGQDSGVTCRGLGALSLWLLGYPDQARQWSDEALVWARALAHPFTLSQALVLSALLQQLLGQASVAQERLEAQQALCTEHGFAVYLAWGTVLQG